MGTYVEIDGKLYVTKEDYLNIVKYYENSLSAERNGAKEEIEELREKNETLKDNVEFLHSCLDDRDKSIAILQEENKNLKDVINEVIKIAYDKDADEAITYLVNLNLFDEKNNNE